MTSAFPKHQRQMLAEQAVEQFTDRFGDAHWLLACHAALPLVLTPELLNYLRTSFLYEQVPWEAEVDLLLSDLCRPVGYELYVMDSNVRAYLLRQMEQDSELGTARMQEVAQRLISYVRYLFQANPHVREQELQAQQWAAMVFLEDRREEAVRQIVEAFQEAIAPQQLGQGHSLISTADMARLVQLTQEFAPQLLSYPELVRYAELVGQLLRSPGRVRDASQIDRTYRVGDRTLPSLSNLLVGTQGLQAVADGLGVTLQTFEFDDAEIVVQSEPQVLPSFAFETVTVNAQGEIVRREQRQASYFAEALGNGVLLDMVAIPGGEFQMGSPEREGYASEKPQHPVTVQPFFMGKYPVTQAQWRAVAGMAQVNRELKPDPSRYKGDNRPVERVSWHEVVEFCDRLSRQTGRDYRLPSEAEWEYACRAGTTTPYHFGEKITPELAKYDSSDGTTPVGSFKVANAFGLFDMHGNVWEWCADRWHENYKGAPADGSAWIEGESSSFVLRGGSWDDFPVFCRSAFRAGTLPVDQDDHFGFRVVCSASRALP